MRKRRPPTRTQLFERGYAEGKAARLAGQSIESCPYREGNYAMKYIGWQTGWHSAHDRTSDPPKEIPT